jgi:AcrR family transcriptional regulator
MTEARLPFLFSQADAPAKRSILVAALDLFATRGVDGVSIRDIAAQAGFTNPAMFRHFKSKEDLAKALFEACYRRFAHSLAAPGVTLRGAVQEALALIDASPESVHFVLENIRRYWSDLPEAVRARGLIGAMRRLIQVEQALGRVRTDIDAQLAAALVLGLLAQIARMAHFNELARPPSALEPDIYNLLDRGLGI